MKNTINSLAYFDSFSGLVPCKVISISDELSQCPGLNGRTTKCLISVRLTATVGAYKKGEIIDSNPLRVIPRSNVRRSKYGTKIIGDYFWQA
jgi:hypothetical protein